jgi:nucleotide-binding universal stress UspA family protein
MFALTRILVPTNLGEPSRAAVKYGVTFARQFDARLYVAHVLPAREFEAALETERVIEVLLPDDLNAEEMGREPTPEEVAKNAAREDLQGLLSSEEERDTHAEYLLRGADARGPGDAIVACAKELDVDLIVMGKHRLGFVEHLLAGSVTEKVVRHAPCPVLIVHYPEHDFIVEERREKQRSN